MNEQTDLENTLKRGLFEQCGFQYGPGMFGQPGVEWGYGYAPYDATDEVYYGAQAVVDMEWRASLQWRHPTKDGDERPSVRHARIWWALRCRAAAFGRRVFRSA